MCLEEVGRWEFVVLIAMQLINCSVSRFEDLSRTDSFCSFSDGVKVGRPISLKDIRGR